MATSALATIQEQIKAAVAAQKAATIPTGSSRISLKGRVFTLPDGRTDNGPMECVILDFRNERKYYTEAYNPSNLADPICQASAFLVEDLKPSDKAQNPQSESCANCPKDEWGSATNGGRGKACQNRVMLAVAPVDATADDEPMLMDISPTSLKSWGKLLNRLSSHGKVPSQVVTEISFNQSVAFPQVDFKEVSALDDETLAVMWKLRDLAQTMLDS